MHRAQERAVRPDGVLVSELLAHGGRLPLNVALAMTLHVARLVGARHATRRVHGGLGPSALWCTREGEVWLEWFPRVLPVHRSLPPEIRGGQQVSYAADVYLLGALAYELLTGLSVSRAWARAPLVELSNVASPAYFNPEVPAAVDALVAAALNRDPSKRPSGMAEIVQTLEPLVTAAGWETELCLRVVSPALVSVTTALPVTCEKASVAAPPPLPRALREPTSLKLAPPPPSAPLAAAVPAKRGASTRGLVLAVALAAVGTLALCWGAARLLELNRPGAETALVVAPPPPTVPMELPELEISPPSVQVQAVHSPAVKSRPKLQRPGRAVAMAKRRRS